MGDTSGSWIWLVFLVVMMLFLYIPRWMAQRQRRQQEAALAVGDRVLTIGGLLGTLTHIDHEKNIARLQIAEGVEIEILIGAISGKRANPSES
jgi:preprotein translocase subunit YajC